MQPMTTDELINYVASCIERFPLEMQRPDCQHPTARAHHSMLEALCRLQELEQPTPPSWEAHGPHGKGKNIGRPERWTYVRHNFPDRPYEGELEDEFGVYPPTGHAGPVALVAGRANAHLIAAAPALLVTLRELLEAEYAPDNLALLAAGYGMIPTEVHEKLDRWRAARERAEDLVKGLPTKWLEDS